MGAATVAAAGMAIIPQLRPDAPPGFLGVSFGGLDQRIAEKAGLPAPKGVYVINASEEFAGYQDGLRPGDILIAMNGSEIVDPLGIQNQIHARKAGETVTFSVIRNGRNVPVPVQLNPRPDEDTITRLSEFPVVPPLDLTRVPLQAGQMNYARRIDLSFYSDVELWEFGWTGSACMASYLVPADGDLIPLNGNAYYIHRFNEAGAPAMSDEASAAQYFEFFSAHIWGEDGPFEVIQDAKELPPGNDAIKFEARPISVTINEDHVLADAAVLYGKQVIEATFRVELSGMMNMMSNTRLHEIVTQDTLFRDGQRCALDLRDVKENDYPVPPAMTGDWEVVDAAEFYVIRQLLIMQEQAAPVR